MDFHDYRLEKQYKDQLHENIRYSNWTEEKDRQLEAAYISNQRMSTLKRAFSLISRCFDDETNDIAKQFKEIENDNKKAQECVLLAGKICLDILKNALCTRRYMNVDEIIKYLTDIREHLNYWEFEREFKIENLKKDISNELLLPRERYILCYHKMFFQSEFHSKDRYERFKCKNDSKNRETN